MGTITLDNGIQIRQVLNLGGLNIKPALYSDVKGYNPNQPGVYGYSGNPPYYIQAVYKRYEETDNPNVLTLWYTVPFVINGNTLTADIPINYVINDKLYGIADYPRIQVTPNDEGAIPISAGSTADTADRIYFPHWMVGTVDYPNQVYINRQPIINRQTLDDAANSGSPVWAGWFAGSLTKTTK